jgi:hypothetical protein
MLGCKLLSTNVVSDLTEYALDGRNTGSANTEAIFAWADAEQISHMSFTGDVNSGKAWEAIRRPFDMVRLMLYYLPNTLTEAKQVC